MKDSNHISQQQGPRVFLIEDEYYAGVEFKHTLRQLRPDYVLVGQAEDVEGAIDFLSCNQVDLIIADIRLSDGYSFEALDQLHLQDVPIIFTTAYAQYSKRATNYRMVDFLLKPIAPDALQQALEKFETETDRTNV
jgi:two-component SAPR family response regulator